MQQTINVQYDINLSTNNHLEGWHNCLRRVVGKSHPNIFECVEVFQREQVSTEARF